MPDPAEHACGCHTIYLLKKSSCVANKALQRAWQTPGAILTMDDPDDIVPMIVHTCGGPQWAISGTPELEETIAG
jgi:hypothetical protein